MKKIIRLQNKELWKKYFIKRSELAEKNGGDPNEQFLFHGTAPRNILPVANSGLDMRLANDAGAIGIRGLPCSFN